MSKQQDDERLRLAKEKANREQLIQYIVQSPHEGIIITRVICSGDIVIKEIMPD